MDNSGNTRLTTHNNSLYSKNIHSIEGLCMMVLPGPQGVDGLMLGCYNMIFVWLTPIGPHCWHIAVGLYIWSIWIDFGWLRWQLCSIIQTVATLLNLPISTLRLVQIIEVIEGLTAFVVFHSGALFLWLILVDNGGKTIWIVLTIRGLLVLFDGGFHEITLENSDF